MAKGNPLLLKRPGRSIWETTLRDPNQPELEFTISTRPLDALGAMDAQSRADVLWDTYGPHVPPSSRKLLPLVDGQSIAVSRHACQIVGNIMAAQAALAEDAYSEVELFAMMTSNEIATQMVQLVGEIAKRSAELAEEPRGPLAQETPSSSQASTQEPDTLRLSTKPTEPSEASTTGSGDCADC